MALYSLAEQLSVAVDSEPKYLRPKKGGLGVFRRREIPSEVSDGSTDATFSKSTSAQDAF